MQFNIGVCFAARTALYLQVIHQLRELQVVLSLLVNPACVCVCESAYVYENVCMYMRRCVCI